MRSIKVFIAIASIYAALNYGFGVFSDPIIGGDAGSPEVAKLPLLDLREAIPTKKSFAEQSSTSAVIHPRIEEFTINVDFEDDFKKILDKKINIYKWDIKKASDKDLMSLVHECTDRITKEANPRYNPTFDFAYYDVGVLKALIAVNASSSVPFHDYNYNSRRSEFNYMKKHRHGYISFVIESTTEGFGGIKRYAARYTCAIEGPGDMVVERDLVHFF